MSKGIGFLLSTTFLFLGVIIGFLLAPAKKGFHCFNNNSIGCGNDCYDNGFDEDYDGEYEQLCGEDDDCAPIAETADNADDLSF